MSKDKRWIEMNLAEKAELVAAARDGARIQAKSDNGFWYDLGKPSFDTPNLFYRVLPKAEYLYLRESLNGNVAGVAYDDEQTCRENAAFGELKYLGKWMKVSE